MANTINYAINFLKQITAKYAAGLKSAGLTTQGVQFIRANQIKIPYLTLGGYKDHSRQGGFNRSNVSNDFYSFTLAFDRDNEVFVDSMDVDESNEAASAANVTTQLMEQHDIPEIDSYRFSKLYTEYLACGGTADTTVLTAGSVLTQFDDWMSEMDDDGVPEEGRILYLTPTVLKLLKTASQVERSIDVSGERALDRRVTRLDNVTLQTAPSARLKTAFNFTDGAVPADDAGQINMILIHPKSVIACDKHSYIRMWAPGTHTQGDGYLYQNRRYGDLFLLPNRAEGVKVNVTPPEE
jgi:hypothetical protein